MKNKNYLYTLLLMIVGIAIFFTSCKKEVIPPYKNSPAIYIFHAKFSVVNDSVNFSFATLQSSILTDTVWIPVRIMGYASDKARKIEIAPIDSLTTAIEGQHYKLLKPYMMPAGAYETRLGVEVKRSADLADTTVRLALRLMPSADFKQGLDTQLNYLITINDMLSKPNYWDDFPIYIFGSYSRVKYKFMIDVTGRSNFNFGSGGIESYGQFLYYKQQVIAALDEYNAAHPGNPLTDEFGDPVTFP